MKIPPTVDERRVRRDARLVRRKARRDGTLREVGSLVKSIDDLTPEELAKHEAERRAMHDEYERVGKICKKCERDNRYEEDEVQNNCDFWKLKGCTKKRLIRNSLGPLQEKIRCPKGQL